MTGGGYILYHLLFIGLFHRHRQTSFMCPTKIFWPSFFPTLLVAQGAPPGPPREEVGDPKRDAMLGSLQPVGGAQSTAFNGLQDMKSVEQLVAL